MRRVRSSLLLFLLVLGASAAPVATAAPLFTLDEDGKTFLYRARPGETPSAVAEMFGVSQHDVPAFLAANGISDPTHVGAGFLYRVPNVAVRALSERLGALEAQNARLTRDAAASGSKMDKLAHDAQEATAAASAADARAARASRLQTLWPALQAALVFLVLGIAAALGLASAALSRQRRAERYARALAAELEEKRKAALLDRQESARRILELEAKTRSLEAQLGPRLLVGGRS